MGGLVLVLLLGIGGTSAYLLTRDDDRNDKASQRDETSDDPSDDTGSGAAPDPQAEPEVGQCRDVPPDGAAPESDASPIVECSAEHTAQTYYLGEFEGEEIDTEYAAAECIPRLPDALGLSAEEAALTAYSVLFFAPDDEQWADGERWLRCDLVVMETDELLPLPTDGELVPDPLPDELAACMDSDSEQVPCDREHAFRATDTYPITGGDTLPDEGRIRAQAVAACPDAAWWTWPSEAAWDGGTRLGVCWEVDS